MPPERASGASRAPTGTAAFLALVQHALFGLLVLIGTVRSLSTGANPLWLALSVTALVLWYAVGTRLARSPGRLGVFWWLTVLTLAWLATILVSPENVWVAVTLWLLAGHFLSVRAAIGYSALVLALVIWAQIHGGMPWGSGMVIGPTVGAVFSLVLSLGQHRLVRDGVERQRLVDSLVRAQAESEELHAELAAVQHESGVLAERTRLSRDIHDGIAQSFSSILLTARAATDDGAGAGDSTTEALAAALRQIEQAAHDGLEESRRVVRALAPRDLADTGLTASLRRVVDSLADQTGIDARLHVEGELSPLPTAIEVALLRVTQGALANVRQHADASRVVVTLSELGDSVRLDIVDDGRGFTPGAPQSGSGTDPDAGGFGLRGSRDRLRALGGGLDIESRPGEGTALTAYLPLGTASAKPSPR